MAKPRSFPVVRDRRRRWQNFRRLHRPQKTRNRSSTSSNAKRRAARPSTRRRGNPSRCSASEPVAASLRVPSLRNPILMVGKRRPETTQPPRGLQPPEVCPRERMLRLSSKRAERSQGTNASRGGPIPSEQGAWGGGAIPEAISKLKPKPAPIKWARQPWGDRKPGQRRASGRSSESAKNRCELNGVDSNRRRPRQTHQLAFLTPGMRPSRAMSRNTIRET